MSGAVTEVHKGHYAFLKLFNNPVIPQSGSSLTITVDEAVEVPSSCDKIIWWRITGGLFVYRLSISFAGTARAVFQPDQYVYLTNSGQDLP